MESIANFEIREDHLGIALSFSSWGLGYSLVTPKMMEAAKTCWFLKVRTFENAAALLEAHKIPEQYD